MSLNNLKEIIESGEVDVLIEVLKKQPKLKDLYINFTPESKHTVHPLHYACDCVFEYKMVEIVALEIVKTLIGFGANINGNAQFMRDTPLIAATSLYCDQIADYLVQEGAELTHKGTHAGTCLHWAAWTGSVQLVKLFIDQGCNIDQVDNEFGASPLHWAINGLLHTNKRNHRKQKEVIQLLIKSGANKLLVDNENRTPYDVAKKAGLNEISEIIISF